MVVKMGKFRFFPPRAEFRIWILINFANPFCGNGMDLYRRDAARHVSTQNGNNTINL